MAEALGFQIPLGHYSRRLRNSSESQGQDLQIEVLRLKLVQRKVIGSLAKLPSFPDGNWFHLDLTVRVVHSTHRPLECSFLSCMIHSPVIHSSYWMPLSALFSRGKINGLGSNGLDYPRGLGL